MLCLGTLAIVALWHKRASRRKPGLVGAPMPVAVQPKAGPIHEGTAPKDPAAAAELRVRRSDLDARAAAGLDLVPYVREGKGTFLMVHLVTVPKCSPGDLEAIDVDMAAGHGDKLLLTLEAPESHGARSLIAAKRLSPSDLKREQTLPMELTQLGRPRDFGMFLCSDIEGSGSCADKPTADFGEIFRTPPGAQRRERWSDKVYYFNYVVLDALGAKIPRQSLLEKEQVERLGPLARSLDGRGAGLAYAQEVAGKVRSLSQYAEPNAVILRLAAFGKGACL